MLSVNLFSIPTRLADELAHHRQDPKKDELVCGSFASLETAMARSMGYFCYRELRAGSVK